MASRTSRTSIARPTASARAVAERVERGEGLLGKLTTKDEALYEDIRKTAANVYNKLAQEIAYSQARDVAARSIDGFMDYLKAQYGRPGERSRWKWDTEIRQDVQHWASGFSMKLFDLPETDHLDLHTRWYSKTEPAECQALLVLPEPDFEARLDLRKILFGLNCDPFHVQ